MAEGLILQVRQSERYRSDELDAHLDYLETLGRDEELHVLMNGKQPRAQIFAGATISEEE